MLPCDFDTDDELTNQYYLDEKVKYAEKLKKQTSAITSLNNYINNDIKTFESRRFYGMIKRKPM